MSNLTNKLSVKSALAMIENMSYDDSEELKEIIFKEKLSKIYCITTKYCSGDQYYIKAKDKEDAINKFIRTEEFLKIRYNLKYGFDFKCCICNELINMDTFINHLKTHKEKTIEFFVNTFDLVCNSELSLLTYIDCLD